MIAYARCMKWAIIGHHVSHGGRCFTCLTMRQRGFDSLQKSHPNALPKHYKHLGGWKREKGALSELP